MNTKLVYGVGSNDVASEVVDCPYYDCWKTMLRDCYYTTVSGAKGTVCDEWLSFYEFREWLTDNGAAGLLALSPDVMTPEADSGKAAHYSPQTARMVSRAIKNHLRKYQRDKENGFSSMIKKVKNRFIARVSSMGKTYYLGCVKTKAEAVSLVRAHNADVLNALIGGGGSHLLSDQTIHELKQQAKVIRNDRDDNGSGGMGSCRDGGMGGCLEDDQGG